MAFKAEDITINMSAGQRASALNHISVLRTALYGKVRISRSFLPKLTR